MQLAVPRWKGMLSAFAWLVLCVALWWTATTCISIMVRAFNGAGGYFNLITDRGLGEIVLGLLFGALPAIVAWGFAVFAQGAIGHRQPWLVRIAATNLVAASVLLIIA